MNTTSASRTLIDSSARPVHVGLDVHKATISIAVAVLPSHGDALQLIDCGKVANTPAAMKRKVTRLTADYGTDLRFVYEAGPCGYALLRRLRDSGWSCDLIAPTEIPKKPGDRVKTDRRDALALARLSASGYLEPLWVPDPSQEALRNLIRDRMDVKAQIRRQRQRIQHFLLRHERRYEGTPWTAKHRAWLHDLKFDESGDQISLRTKSDLVDDLARRLDDLERDIERELPTRPWRPVIDSLRALRGVDRLTAVTLMAELGDLRRFPSAPQFMGYLGLTPSEYSSGAKRQTGAITKTGNGTVRRLLTESAWTYRFPARDTHHLQRKAVNASDYAKARAWEAQKRLCGKYRTMLEQGKQVKTVVTAIARELAGYLWDIACHEMNDAVRRDDRA